MIKIKMMLWLSLLASGVAWSQMPMDTDGDGVVSFTEFQARSEERFAQLDEDGNGLLTREELGAWRDRGGRRGFAVAAADTDGDGVLSFAELQAVRPGLTEERFARMDANGDGFISEDERPRRSGRGPRGRGSGRDADETIL